MTEDIKSYHLYILLGCPFCEKAVNLLENKKQRFVISVMDNDLEELEETKQTYSHKTVPIVIGKTINNKQVLIGGCSELEQRLNA
jgi:glutaredoxin